MPLFSALLGSIYVGCFPGHHQYHAGRNDLGMVARVAADPDLTQRMRVVPVAPCILAAQHALQRCGFRFHDFEVVAELASGSAQELFQRY